MGYDELSHYGVKGMRWGVRRKRSDIAKYRSLYDDLNKNSSRLNKAMNKLAGSDKVYARAKYVANRNVKTSGIGSARSVLNKASADGKVAYMESLAKNRGTSKTTRQRLAEAKLTQKTASKLSFDESKAKNAAEKVLRKLKNTKVSSLPTFLRTNDYNI